MRERGPQDGNEQHTENEREGPSQLLTIFLFRIAAHRDCNFYFLYKKLQHTEIVFVNVLKKLQHTGIAISLFNCSAQGLQLLFFI